MSGFNLTRRRLLTLAWLLLILPCAARAADPTLEQLRADLAMRYLEPAPHMALAKYYVARGDRLTAFYILEYARRSRFEQEEFDRAFALAFGDSKPVDDSKAAEDALLARRAREPNSREVVVGLADIYVARGEWAKAKRFLREAIRLRPDAHEEVYALSQVLRREGSEAEARRLLEEFVRAHPDSYPAHEVRASAIVEKEPAKAKPLLLEALRKFPEAGDLHFNLGIVLHKEDKLQEAEASFARAAELSKNSVAIQAWTGRFFHKVRQDDRRALDYYLNAYLLDPHAYETEFVESRIRQINWEAATARFQQRLKSGDPFAEILRDANPTVAVIAAEHAAEKWDRAYVGPLVELMGHDDDTVRANAAEAIKKNADRSFDPTLRALLKDGDLRRRGLAFYIAVKLWQQESFPLMREALKEQAQLLRYDAISALVLEGGEEGRRVALEHRPRETHPTLKKTLDMVAENKISRP